MLLLMLHLMHMTGLGLRQLHDSLKQAPAQMALQEWPVPPAAVLKQVVDRLSVLGTSDRFTFGSLVR